MSPKEKADLLLHKMYIVDSFDDNDNKSMDYDYAIKCAIIAVDEILNSIPFDYEFTEKFVIYWQEVKQELELLL